MSLACYTPMFRHKLPFHKPSSVQNNPLGKRYSSRLRTSQASRINMAYITTDEGITRRIGNHHPNLWDDDFIQSLPKIYDAPSYGEHAEKLIKEIKGMFDALPQNTSSADDLYKRLSMVDDVERLGIDRHFQNEIKVALDFVYRYWNDMNGIGCGRESPCVDLNTTALGFRILRLHRYNVSSDMLQQFKSKDGQFLNSKNKSSEEQLRSILNLFRASLIVFPRERILDDVKVFSTAYLKQALPNISNTNLLNEIKFNLEYGWHTSVPRLEARTYIDIYRNVKSTNKYFQCPITYPSTNSKLNLRKNLLNFVLTLFFDINLHVLSLLEHLQKVLTLGVWNFLCFFNSRLLELAKLDFNMIQSIQIQELQILSRWWTKSGLPAKLEFARHRHVEFYFWAASGCIEPKYSAFRIGFAKMATFVTCLDDIYDTYGTLDELKIFTEAIKRWNLASMEGLPEFMKLTFKVFDEGLRDMAQEAEKTQGRGTLDYAHKAWEVYIDAYFQEAKWLAMDYMPSFDEYLENGKVSSGARVVTLQPVLSLDVPLSNDVLKEIDYPSRFNDLLCLTLRLRGDTKTFKAEADRGEVVSCITCYMKDHPGSTEEDALEYINHLIDEKLKELNWEYLKSDNVPIISKDHAYVLSKGLQLLYKERDGFSVSDIETKNLITKIIIETVPM